LFLLPANLPLRTARLLGWLTPATAAVMLAFASLHSDTDGSHSRPMTLSLSNQNYAAFTVNFANHGENAPCSDFFEWTNLSRSTSSIGSYLQKSIQ
jgi:hypothetical protein